MSRDYDGDERRSAPYELSDEQIERIATRAYEKATERIYLEIGKATVRAALYILGAAGLTLLAWLGLTKEMK